MQRHEGRLEIAANQNLWSTGANPSVQNFLSLSVVAILGVLAAIAPVAAQAPPATIQSPSGGVVHALVVGIDKFAFPKLPTLAGAVADARDLAGTLKRAGVVDLTVLLDDRATRANITGEIERLIRDARPGDLVIVSMASHGSQEKTAVSFNEPDGLDEVVILGGFMPEGEAARERIVDDEIFLWLERFSKKGIGVLFLADICSGGGLTKAPGPGDKQPAVRGVSRVYAPKDETYGTYFIPDESVLLPKPATPAMTTGAIADLDGLTFVAGAEAGTVVTEVEIAGEARGLASFAIARSFEGLADANRDGVVTHRELLRYIRTEVQRMSAFEQRPVTEPRGRNMLEKPVFRFSNASAPPVTAPTAKYKASSSVAASPHAGFARPRLAPVQLRFAQEQGTLKDPGGSILARGIARDEIDRAASAYEARRLFEALANSAKERELPVELRADSARPGSLRIKAPTGATYVSVLAISALGKVQLVFPNPRQDQLIQDEDFELQLAQQGNLTGAETIVVLASHNRPHRLNNALKPFAGTLKPVDTFNAVFEAIDHRTRIGVVLLNP